MTQASIEPTPPPYGVLEAFGLLGKPREHMKRGITQQVWRVGDVVVKPIGDPAETQWTCTVLDAMEEDGFRVVKPVRARNGAWIAEGYTAWHWIDGEPQKNRWLDIVAASRAMHEELLRAASRVGVDVKPAFIDARSHRCALAERAVWYGAAMPTFANYDVPEYALFERARRVGPPLREDQWDACQLVHGDIANNVLWADDTTPTFIDMSPGWRTLPSVETQVIVEGVAWFGGDTQLLVDLMRRDGVAEIARVCAWRLLCGFQALMVGLEFSAKEIANWTKVLDVIGA